MSNTFQEKLAQQRGKTFVSSGPAGRFKAATREDQLIADSGHLVHKLKAKDSTGRWAYYFILISSHMEQVFLRDLKANKVLDLENYGKVLASNYGEEPSHEVAKMLKTKFGWDVQTTRGETDEKA